jgi:hypothetical protein
MIRLYDLNACEWRVYASPESIPAGNFRTENGMRWVGLQPTTHEEPQPETATAPKRAARKKA